MEYGIENQVLVAKLDDGEDFFESLEEIMSDIDQECGVLVTAIGMLREFELGYYNMESGEYEFEEYEKPMELVSVSGSITEDGSMHMHAELADEDHKVIGGHLEEAQICNVNEITMLVFDDLKMAKKYYEGLDTELLSVGWEYIGYEQVDHTADVGIHAYGEDLEDAFEETAKGMFSIITDLSKVDTKDDRQVEVESDNLESLLVKFLSELIYLHEVNNELYSEFDVKINEDEEFKLTASIEGEKVNLEKHEMETAVKAVSYHELRIDTEGDIEIILDI